MENEQWITGNITLKVAGQPLDLELTVPSDPVRPDRMLPVFQKMTDSFVEMSVAAAAANGEKVSCAKGCGACCRQAVPVSVIEAIRLAEVVEAMPIERQTLVKKRFADSLAHFEAIGWFDRIRDLSENRRQDPQHELEKKINEAVMEYFGQSIECPFLENESCTIHEDRPLACREYLVTSPAENCVDPTNASIDMVNVFLKPSKPIRFLGVDPAAVRFIPLIESLAVAEAGSEVLPEKSGERWLAEFFTVLTGSPIPES